MIEFIIAKAIKHEDGEDCGFKAITSYVKTWTIIKNDNIQVEMMTRVLQFELK